jgi:hypothetical protein
LLNLKVFFIDFQWSLQALSEPPWVN